MLFNSLEFAIFIPVVFVLYWFVLQNKIRLQNALVLVASYTFYGWWDWRFLGLILFSTIIDFFAGMFIEEAKNKSARKAWLGVSMFVNLGFLGFFKYYNFFINSLNDAFTLFGQPINIDTLNIILPVGISFYTFQTMSYSIDIYRKEINANRDFMAFAAYVAFFPQLVAGPIERASNLLPQFYIKRTFDVAKAKDGLRQILWGLFKKIVVADNCAKYADDIYGKYESYEGSTLAVGTVYFAIQIYCDFSAYSDIAIGTARLFGFELKRNFAYPIFSRSIAEFWRRWHISLNTWFRDYVYIPMGGSRVSKLLQIRNVFIIFFISGVWHGANWTFIVYGIINSFLIIPSFLLKTNRKHIKIAGQGKLLPNFTEIVQMLTVFILTCLTRVFFRSETLDKSFTYLGKVFSASLFTKPEQFSLKCFFFFGVLVLIEWIQREQQHPLVINENKIIKPIRWMFYFALIITIFVFGGPQSSFIYFQF